MSEIVCRGDVEVTLVKHVATDRDVIDAARVSTLGEQTVNADLTHARVTGLISYLMRDRHGSPFEHNSMTFLVKAPIFVAREFMRHRIGWSYNEESGRYRELQPEFYTPGPDRKLIQVGKPGAYQFEPGTNDQYTLTRELLTDSYRVAYKRYEIMLSEGIAREVARMCLPVGLFTTFYATCNARSLMHFLSLRTQHDLAATASFPQREIEMVAEQMEDEWAAVMPVTHTAFNEHGRCAP